MSVPEILGLARTLGIDATGAKSIVSGEGVQTLLSDFIPAGDLNACRVLVLEAFTLARTSGKPDWQEMTLAVLKNRLISATSGEFSEIEYGAPNMAYFAYLFSEILQISDASTRPQRVKLREDALSDVQISSPPIASLPNQRMRPDLWNAFFDYRNHDSYVWDLDLQKAVAGHPSARSLEIPSLTPQQEVAFRREFKSSLTIQSAAHEAEVDEWISKRLGTVGLPFSLRGPWNRFLRDQLVNLAENFFANNGLSVPSDLLTQGAVHKHSKSESTLMRDFVLRCVGVMTEQELASLPLSADILFRVNKEN